MKNIPVKLYLDAEAYIATKLKCAAAGVSMSTGGSLALREWQPAHRTRRQGQSDRAGVALKRPLSFPGRSEVGGMRRLH